MVLNDDNDQAVSNMDRQQQPPGKLLSDQVGETAMKNMYELFETMLKTGHDDITEVVKRLDQEFINNMVTPPPKDGSENKRHARMKRYVIMLNYMTEKLMMDESGMTRVAEASGQSVEDVRSTLENYKGLAKIWSNILNRESGRNGIREMFKKIRDMKQIGSYANYSQFEMFQKIRDVDVDVDAFRKRIGSDANDSPYKDIMVALRHRIDGIKF